MCYYSILCLSVYKYILYILHILILYNIYFTEKRGFIVNATMFFYRKFVLIKLHERIERSFRHSSDLLGNNMERYQ